MTDGNSYDGNHRYVVWFEDEYSNCYLLGFFDELRDAEPLANGYLKLYKSDPDGEFDDESKYVQIRLGEDSPFGPLVATMGTLGPGIFMEFPCGEGSVSVRGFVLK